MELWRSAAVFRYAIIFLIISLLAGGVGLTNISVIAKRISLVLFALFFLGFLALLGFAVSARRGYQSYLAVMAAGRNDLRRRSHAAAAQQPCAGDLFDKTD
jgi:uncharacterized membrane protein YtjA (UPF0391 family)